MFVEFSIFCHFGLFLSNLKLPTSNWKFSLFHLAPKLPECKITELYARGNEFDVEDTEKIFESCSSNSVVDICDLVVISNSYKYSIGERKFKTKIIFWHEKTFFLSFDEFVENRQRTRKVLKYFVSIHTKYFGPLIFRSLFLTKSSKLKKTFFCVKMQFLSFRLIS